MKQLFCGLIVLLLLTTTVAANEQIESLLGALPREVSQALPEDMSTMDGLTQGVNALVHQGRTSLSSVLQSRVRNAALVLLVVVACGLMEGMQTASGQPDTLFVTMAGALSITLLSAGSLDSLLGLGATTMDTLSVFSKVLLPTMAAATAATGAVTSASVGQVTTVFFVDLLLNLMQGLLLPMVYLYIGALTAGVMLPQNRMESIATALKKIITWCLCTAMFVFTLYLSLVRVIAGSVDAVSVKLARAAISGAVPVVGGIIADASETVLAGAGMLKNSVGILGTLGILGCCFYPFLQLGIQYLLYKATAFLAGLVGPPSLCKLIDGLGGAFGLMLGMTGACALLLLVSVLSSIAVVSP